MPETGGFVVCCKCGHQEELPEPWFTRIKKALVRDRTPLRAPCRVGCGKPGFDLRRDYYAANTPTVRHRLEELDD